MLTESHIKNNHAPVVLDGPSALAFYRDRCVTIDKARRPVVERSYVGTPNPKDEDFWLSDEDVVAFEAAGQVFGAQAFDDEREQDGVRPLIRSRSRDLSRCTGNSRDFKRIAYQDLGIRPPTSTSPLHVLVGKPAAKRVVANVHERCLSTRVPANGLRRLDNTVLVPTPELTFLLLAGHLSLVQLIMVGMELCGHYRLAGAETSTLLHSCNTLYNQRPHTTLHRLEGYLANAGGFPGVTSARRAARYVAPFSASPMETVVFLLLCLPRSLGGYALPRPILNAKRKVVGPAESITMSKHLIPDLYWPSAGIDVEYDSEEFHSNPDNLAAGARRTLALRAMHVDVIVLTHEIVYNVDSFDAAARMLRRALGKRTPAEDSLFRKRRSELRATLLT